MAFFIVIVVGILKRGRIDKSINSIRDNQSQAVVERTNVDSNYLGGFSLLPLVLSGRTKI